MGLKNADERKITQPNYYFYHNPFIQKMRNYLFVFALCMFGMSVSSQAQLGKINKLLKKNETPVAPTETPNQGITSPLHTKYMGKMVFASTEEAITFQQEKEAEFKDKFVLGQPIFLRVYMSNSLINYAQKLSPTTSSSILKVHARYRIKFYLNGELAHTSVYSETDFSSEDKEKMTTFKDALYAPDRNFILQPIFRSFMTKNEQKLSVGMHKLKIELLPYISYPNEAEGAVAAMGEFSLEVKENSIDPNDPKVCLPKAGMTDAKLEAAILEAFKAKASQGGWKEQPKFARITSTKWNIIKNQNTGLIIKKYVDAVIVSNTKEGKCIYQTFGFSQDYMGGSAFQEDIYLDGIGSQKDINCKCLK